MINVKLKMLLGISIVANLLCLTFVLIARYTYWTDMAQLNWATNTLIPRFCAVLSEQTYNPNNAVCKLKEAAEKILGEGQIPYEGSH